MFTLSRWFHMPLEPVKHAVYVVLSMIVAWNRDLALVIPIIRCRVRRLGHRKTIQPLLNLHGGLPVDVDAVLPLSRGVVQFDKRVSPDSLQLGLIPRPSRDCTYSSVAKLGSNLRGGEPDSDWPSVSISEHAKSEGTDSDGKEPATGLRKLSKSDPEIQE
jgi:hypothetical protein